jgi:hypothetical protein
VAQCAAHQVLLTGTPQELMVRASTSSGEPYQLVTPVEILRIAEKLDKSKDFSMFELD